MGRVFRILSGIVLLAGGWHSAQARYLQPDPLGIEGGGPNLYAYADSNPVMNIDPDGLQFLPYSKNLNRTSVHPYRIPEGLAQQLNVPYAVGAGVGVLSSPPIAGALGTVGARVAMCAAEEATANFMFSCALAGVCLDHKELQHVQDRQRTEQMRTDSRSRARNLYEILGGT